MARGVALLCFTVGHFLAAPAWVPVGSTAVDPGASTSLVPALAPNKARCRKCRHCRERPMRRQPYGTASESKGPCCGSHFRGSHDPGIDERASALPRSNGALHGLVSAAANPVDRAVASLAGTSPVAVKTLRLSDVIAAKHLRRSWERPSRFRHGRSLRPNSAISYKAGGGCRYFREIQAGTLTGHDLPSRRSCTTGMCPVRRLVGLAESRKNPAQAGS